MSLADVAAEAQVSAATLSRVERDKQAIGIELFMTLARVLHAVPAELLDNDDSVDADSDGALATRIATMQTRDRTRFWHQLNEERKEQRVHKRNDSQTVAIEFEELLAQMDFLRAEIESVRVRLAKKR